MGACAGILWGWLNICLGGIDTPIKALAILMCCDFITGVAAGFHTGNLDSSIGAKGLWKKVGVFVCIAFAYLLDLATSMNMFRGMLISGFSIIEAISLIENIDRMGCGFMIPEFMKEKLKQIAEERHLKEVDNCGKSQH